MENRLTCRDKFGRHISARDVPRPIPNNEIVNFDSNTYVDNSLILNYETREKLRTPKNGNEKIVIDMGFFAPEGKESAHEFLVEAYKKGWKYFVTYNWRGQRFTGCGFGENSRGVRIDVYGNPGNYAASGNDGIEFRFFCDIQDECATIMGDGLVVVYGNVGQAFMYGAKGGEAYISGSVAGRALINAVAKPRVIINGTALDYLAESFMAGDPLNGGGFVIVNGIEFDENGNLREKEEPYPGGNLFSLASGGAVYVRDPHRKIGYDQLNGGEIAPLSEKDWETIFPYLQKNEIFFGITLDDLLTADERKMSYDDVYIKIVPAKKNH